MKLKEDVLKGKEVKIDIESGDLADFKLWLRQKVGIPEEVALGIKWSPHTKTATVKMMRFSPKEIRNYAEKNILNPDVSGLLSAMIIQLLENE